MYLELYDIEDRARDMTPELRQALRAREARPVWTRIGELLQSEAASQVLPKDKFAQALNYLRNQWDALQLYLSDGRLPIDNNEVQQLIKQVAIGRKNWRAPEVPSRTSGRSKARDALLAMFERTVAVWSAICI